MLPYLISRCVCVLVIEPFFRSHRLATTTYVDPMLEPTAILLKGWLHLGAQAILHSIRVFHVLSLILRLTIYACFLFKVKIQSGNVWFYSKSQTISGFLQTP